jgi:hypothetical protein
LKKANLDSPIDVAFSVFDLVILILKILAKICFNSTYSIYDLIIKSIYNLKKDARIERLYN